MYEWECKTEPGGRGEATPIQTVVYEGIRKKTLRSGACICACMRNREREGIAALVLLNMYLCDRDGTAVRRVYEGEREREGLGSLRAASRVEMILR